MCAEGDGYLYSEHETTVCSKRKTYKNISKNNTNRNKRN
jgi:hypothetical protein